MEFFFDIEQGTDQWHELRHGTIGGTRAKGLFVNSDTLFLELLAEYSEPFDPEDEDSFVSDAMERGKWLEPEARAELSRYTGIDFIECGFIKNDIPILGISPDGISKDYKVQCEIKCPEAKKHISTCYYNEIPLDNIHQCIHAFTVNNYLERFFFMSFRPENKLKPMFVKELNRNSIVNIGTHAKPLLKPISEVVMLAKNSAIALDIKLKESINTLNF